MSFWSIQKDSVFSQIDSPEFLRKYINHDFPAVANIAASMLKLSEKKTDLQEMKLRLEALREEERAYLENLRLDQEYNRMSPGEFCPHQLCIYHIFID